jgi:hypothetical protein
MTLEILGNPYLLVITVSKNIFYILRFVTSDQNYKI